VSLISAGALIVIASFLVSALERALDRVFRAEKKRNYFHSKIVAVGFLFVFILLFAAPGVIGFVQGSLLKAGLMNKATDFVISGDMFFFFVAFCAFLLSTTFIPNHKVFMRYTFIGAIAFTVLTGAARLVFREYIAASWNRYNLIYDSLTVLIVMIIWVYYVANIYLLSAELVARLQEGMLLIKGKSAKSRR
jgi:membrane protein